MGDIVDCAHGWSWMCETVVVSLCSDCVLRLIMCESCGYTIASIECSKLLLQAIDNAKEARNSAVKQKVSCGRCGKIAFIVVCVIIHKLIVVVVPFGKANKEILLDPTFALCSKTGWAMRIIVGVS